MRMDETERQESYDMGASQPAEQDNDQQAPAAQSSDDIETSFVLGYS